MQPISRCEGRTDVLAKERVHGILSQLIKTKDGIAMSQQNSPQNFERDRVGRIMARERRVAVRVARHFAEPDSRLAREVIDILARMPEDDPREAWHVSPQNGAQDW